MQERYADRYTTDTACQQNRYWPEVNKIALIKPETAMTPSDGQTLAKEQ